MQRQFTSTVYIFHEGRTLLLWHKKHSKWMAPGGHMEPNETPPEAARREVLEETGLEIDFIKQENVWFDHPHAGSIERPYLVLLENIPAYGEMPEHQHIDFLFVARPKSVEQVAAHENLTLRWFTLEDVEALKPDLEIFLDAQKTLVHLFQSELVAV